MARHQGVFLNSEQGTNTAIEGRFVKVQTRRYDPGDIFGKIV